MTAIIKTILGCDDPACPREDIQPGISSSEEAVAAADGWTRIDGKDYCPECARDHQEPQEAVLERLEGWIASVRKVDDAARADLRAILQKLEQSAPPMCKRHGANRDECRYCVAERFMGDGVCPKCNDTGRLKLIDGETFPYDGHAAGAAPEAIVLCTAPRHVSWSYRLVIDGRSETAYIQEGACHPTWLAYPRVAAERADELVRKGHRVTIRIFNFRREFVGEVVWR
jgi:hypothetical protein